MRSRYQVREPHAAHFVTSNIVAWLPVFTSARCCDLLPESFASCREHKGLLIHAWVILDNHRGGGWEQGGWWAGEHAIVAGPELSQTLSDLKHLPLHQHRSG